MPPRRSTAAVVSALGEGAIPKTPNGLKKTPSGQFTPITSKSSIASDDEDADEAGALLSDGSSSVRVLGGRDRRARNGTRMTPASENRDQRGIMTPPSASGSLRREVSVEVQSLRELEGTGRGRKKADVVEISSGSDAGKSDVKKSVAEATPVSRKRKAKPDPDEPEVAIPTTESRSVRAQPAPKKARTSTSTAARSNGGATTSSAESRPSKQKSKLESDSSDLDDSDIPLGGGKMRSRRRVHKSLIIEDDRSTSKGFSDFEGDVDELLSEEDDDGLTDTRISKHSEVSLHRAEKPQLAKGKLAVKREAKGSRGKGRRVKDEDTDMLASGDDADEKPYTGGGGDTDEEELMLQAAIHASMATGGKGKSKTTARGGNKSKNAIASGSGARTKVKKEEGRSVMAEKMARAADRRLGKVIDSPSLSEEDSDADPDFDGESGSDAMDMLPGGSGRRDGSPVRKKVFPRGILKKGTAYASTSGDELAGKAVMKAARAEQLQVKKAYASTVLAARKALIKKLGRGLTQGEKNGVSLGLHHPELADVWGDVEANIQVVTPVPMEADPRLRLTLMPFQKESLYWMKKQEEGPWKGGMLADEMGMGKTIQTIALLLSEPRKKPSLVVAPVVALSQWKREIETHAEGFTVCLWHGSGRMKAAELKKYDVVLVSYGTLEASFRKQQKGFKRGNVMVTEKSPMHSFKWFRIILDEAHNIKERSTNVSKAAFALDAEYRWCLSGTPLQNRVGELYSLVRFLGGDPFAFYFCKLCDCKSLHWAFKDKRHCEQCNHSPMQHLCFWNNEILTPIQKFGMAGPGQFAFKKLKILLDRMMLRRTKLERADDLGLPPRVITIRRDYFSPQEKELYQSLFMETKRQFSSYVAEGTVLNKYSSIFSLITRMRQMSCHPDLVLRSKTAQYIKGIENEVVCRLCNDSAEDAIISKCNHVFDRECIRQYLEACAGEGIPDCPVCHVSISIDLEGASIDDSSDKRVTKRQGILGRMDLENWRSSTKVEAIVEVLSDQRNRDCTIKTIVFSQFVSFLDIIAFRLQRAGFNICRIEGGMSLQARDATIQHYMKNPAVTVMLISLRAGGVALNLTEASTVIMADSWWNPSVEYQAFDRVHRFGQRRPVNVIKLVIEDSIESKIVQLQEKKLLMTEAALSKDPDAAAGKLSIDDLQFLFKL